MSWRITVGHHAFMTMFYTFDVTHLSPHLHFRMQKKSIFVKSSSKALFSKPLTTCSPLQFILILFVTEIGTQGSIMFQFRPYQVPSTTKYLTYLHAIFLLIPPRTIAVFLLERVLHKSIPRSYHLGC